MGTLFFIVFIDLVGFGMIIPVLPFFALFPGFAAGRVSRTVGARD